jgi:hypothetical protein
MQKDIHKELIKMPSILRNVAKMSIRQLIAKEHHKTYTDKVPHA